uniref:PTTG1 interacting protein n=1 Tax=Suricata suricatta TaxID=37032 RepID=A0A673SXJ5_SURSU
MPLVHGSRSSPLKAPPLSLGTLPAPLCGERCAWAVRVLPGAPRSMAGKPVLPSCPLEAGGPERLLVSVAQLGPWAPPWPPGRAFRRLVPMTCLSFPCSLFPEHEQDLRGVPEERLLNFEALIITMSVVGGVVLLAVAVCCCACCCRRKRSRKPDKEEEKAARAREERRVRQEERRAEMKSRHDEIRKKYGLFKEENPYARFENN